MNQPQYPQQQPGWGAPQQPGWGAPQGQQQYPGWGAPPPPPPKKSNAGKIIAGVLGAVAVIIVFGVAANSGSSPDDDKGETVTANDNSQVNEQEAPAEAAPAEEEPKKADEPQKSQAQQFKDCVAKEGTASEKKAVGHVTKVTGADEQNNILDAPEVFTDFTGGLMGPHTGDGKLIASAFASCYESDNGLVTVYDKDGEILSNGNY
ncbi:hypothetical protein [Streptomyces sporangiiformans]|uniref:Uncharacterized protein n=1 Tax=Streptomyces sporangiiformans TaxID=2315329 RepID=A0A505DGQ6_9ACTN|nr:hypothetical protein [Streptomyces sporangiiformans]TPQ21942.1 hypothetical protein FGD71_012420 [Streptomyces sporangiiformans]